MDFSRVALSDLVAPLDVETFRSHYWDRQPVHLPSPAGGRGSLLTWERFSELLGTGGHWTAANLKLILNSRPILPDFYLDGDPAAPIDTRRADPARVGVFLGMGASLVADDVERIAPELRRWTTLLGTEFAALTNANVYCSFKGVQAFATHYDLHDVFALQCEGEKVWRIYRNRAENPVSAPHGGEEVQRQIDAARGDLMAEVRMRPGDVLYLPRGCYHDALAQEGASLHVSFAVAPLGAMALLRALEEAALREPAFRAYLADARSDDGQPLEAQFQALARRLGELAGSPLIRDAVIDAQRARTRSDYAFTLPKRLALDSYARTQRPAQVEWHDVGMVLRTQSGAHPLGTFGTVADYALTRPAFSAQELRARFAHVPAEEHAALLALLVRERLFERYTPQV
ncbi:JmjC domain-containing protein [Sphingomonas sp. PAMC 26621]|uniref:JmjC domain-containing protein n=1 Tax=Sphingomonas sp. PAMC 26621 TaxID=1112213 RepID=UPI00028864C2|nr:cupin domain-containing protein [Sphingomonas sp. PAMC 26621]